MKSIYVHTVLKIRIQGHLRMYIQLFKYQLSEVYECAYSYLNSDSVKSTYIQLYKLPQLFIKWQLSMVRIFLAQLKR